MFRARNVTGWLFLRNQNPSRPDCWVFMAEFLAGLSGGCVCVGGMSGSTWVRGGAPKDTSLLFSAPGGLSGDLEVDGEAALGMGSRDLPHV